MPRKLPPGWSIGPMSDAIDLNPKRPLGKRTEVQFLEMAALPLGGAVVKKFAARPVTDGGAKFQRQDTLFARITPCAENGKLGYVQEVPGGGVGQGSTEFIVMAAKPGITIPKFVTVLAAWDVVRSQAISFMEGTSGRQRVPSWAFDLIEVPVPTLAEQERVVAVLESLQDLIVNEQSLVGETDRLPKSRLFRAKQVIISDFLLGTRPI